MSDGKKGQQVEYCITFLPFFQTHSHSLTRCTVLDFMAFLVRFYSLKSSPFLCESECLCVCVRMLYCQQYFPTSVGQRKEGTSNDDDEEKNRLSMLSIEFLWAMKGKISVFTTFMIAKYFYVRAARVFFCAVRALASSFSLCVCCHRNTLVSVRNNRHFFLRYF